ncbi:GNAT family N-acetyltransferase [Microlunatus parietis]|uniref:GNAT superfamily N-acetyltransferase n=1 Tax=Microlunatus parietis TaxID=682979 RepID=A0A7Y9I3J9_9ACTN|nr:GNAT family N-acetyltransferase [Microlunatus parietis]NYE69351.1 GNAT superfamily N-acetyltransferase [Microlunatus parietis]
MKLRPAHPDDAATIDELLHQLGYPQHVPGATAARLTAWADHPDGAAYVAEVDGTVLGVVAVHCCPFFERDGSWGRIVALVVSLEARGLGVGSRLVAEAEAFAAGRGCVRMEVTSADRRRDAHAFYRRLGYVDQSGRSSRFLRDLPGEPPERR